MGRTLSFTLAALCAGLFGGAVQALLIQYHIPAFTCCLFGGGIVLLGVATLVSFSLPGISWVEKRMGYASKRLTILLLQNGRLPTFLFGFSTVFLPCGQTLLVFSACAMADSLSVAAMNGFAFACFTSPSLFFAMRANRIIRFAKGYYHQVMGVLALFVGGMAILRGLAELEVIEHCVVHVGNQELLSLVLF